MISTLFDVSPGDVATTTDDWYTPRWLFDAAGLVFDMDVAAPVNPEYRTCPARQYLTPIEDGLTAGWHGLVWMNPPFSRTSPWADRWAEHPTGLALVPATRQTLWLGVVTRAADAIALISPEFSRPDGSIVRPGPVALVLASRGEECTEALVRVAMRDRYAAGAYHLRPVNGA